MKKSLDICLLCVIAMFSHFVQAQLSVLSYGAKCDGNTNTGSGTNDTAAFQAAANAANNLYMTTGSPVTVQLPTGQSCVVNGTVIIGSGVQFQGPGTIIVVNQSGGTLLFQDANDVGVENITINVISGPGGNDANLSAISWRGTSSNITGRKNIAFRNNTVIDGSWGILVQNDLGTGSVNNVNIQGNTVMSRVAYSNADGIHVAGNVHGITISGNRISNRHDAAIALTSDGSQLVLSGAVVSNNTCIDNVSGLDNSGATYVIWSNNYVRSTAPINNSSNPAARSIVYAGVTPVNVKFIGNYLENYQGTGTDAVAKVDDSGSNLATNVQWVGNTIVGAFSMWIAGNTIALHDNFFSDGATVYVEYDSVNNYPGQNIMIGPNYWMGNGTIYAGGNPGLYSNNSLAHQQANGTLTVIGQSNFRNL